MIARVDAVVTIESLVLVIVPVPFDICLDCGFVSGETTCCLDTPVLLLIVVVEVDATVFCETIVEYWRTGNVVVVEVGYVKCGGALVESAEVDDGVVVNIDFDANNTLDDCCCNWDVFGEDTWVVDEWFAPEFVLNRIENKPMKT